MRRTARPVGRTRGPRGLARLNQSTLVRFAVTGEGLNPLTSRLVPTESSQAAMGSMASMVMPEDCSLCPNMVAKFAANSSGARPTPQALGGSPHEAASECLSHDVLNRVGDKWSFYVIALLDSRCCQWS